jgi:hypothetical protein
MSKMEKMEKINLKEAGRFSNFFNSILAKINNSIYEEAKYSEIPNLVQLQKITETHKKSLALDTEDIVKEDTSEYLLKIDELKNLTRLIILEKINLSNAIAKAKKEELLDIKIEDKVYAFDSAIEYTKLLQKTSASFYGVLLDSKNSEVKETRGRDYTFNEEGNQVEYLYPIEIKTESFINKTEIRKDNQEIKKLSNLLSMEIDNISTLKVIKFESKFNYLDSFEELIQNFKK